MEIALLVIFAIGVTAYVIFGLRKHLEKGTKKNKECHGGDACGVSCLCDDKALERQLSDEIVYFDDEELDTFKGIPSDAYTDEQVEAFSEILTTLQPGETADWLHSLQLRGIALPEQLREEVTIMMQ